MKKDIVENRLFRIIALIVGGLLGLVFGAMLEFINPTMPTQPIKAATKGYCVTLYNHDGSIRGQYHNVTQFDPGFIRYSYSGSSPVLFLKEYEVYINGDYVISPEKD